MSLAMSMQWLDKMCGITPTSQELRSLTTRILPQENNIALILKTNQSIIVKVFLDAVFSGCRFVCLSEGNVFIHSVDKV